jgi:chromosome segregation ATPase
MPLEERVEHLEKLMERLININLSTQEQIGFLAATLRDTRQDVANIDQRLTHLDQRLTHLDAGQSDLNLKLDVILRHITGMDAQQ